VWFSRSYVDVLQAGTMRPFYEWLLRDPDLADTDLLDTGLVDGGGDWVVLRVSDPAQPNGTPGPAGHPCDDFGGAYSSPWWLTPA
jgi:hypothetical protein